MLRRAYTDKMIGTAADDQKSRDKYYFAIHALTDVETALTTLVQNGRIDEANELRKQKLLEKA